MKNLKNEQYLQTAIEIANKHSGSLKANAIKDLRDTTDLDLISARKLIDEAYRQIESELVTINSEAAFEFKPITTVSLSGVKLSGKIGQPLHGVLQLNQTMDGMIYINSNTDIRFKLLEYTWSGPLYNTVSNSQTVGKSKGKTKKKGRAVGALVGTFIMPGVGTAIGAMAGNGNKKQTSTTQSNTITKDTNIEMDAPATLQLENIDTKEILVLSCNIRSFTNADLLSLRKYENIEESYVLNETSYLDPYEEIKKAKELLELEIITQEEFDQKKKELLGL